MSEWRSGKGVQSDYPIRGHQFYVERYRIWRHCRKVESITGISTRLRGG